MENQLYRTRINKALKYMGEHLSEEITISHLADAAHFSPFHFQRIYKALQSETPYDTILRLRLEKSVFLLKHYRSKPIAEVAFESGFSSIENFSRQFKKRFAVSPSAFRKDKELQKSRIYQEQNEYDFYYTIEESRREGVREFPVTIEQVEGTPIALVRAFFGADGSGLLESYHHLMEWGEKRGFRLRGERCRFGMSIDDPDVTPVGLYRYDFALAVDRGTEGEGIVEIGEIPAGAYVTLHCEGTITDVAQAWDYLYQVWLPESTYLPLHYPAIEEFVKGPEEIGWEKFDIKCRILVRKGESL
ncbi:MAG: AraC family transcriptional regulator [Ignavibacteriae bacterium]|nr:AraC family transcriptional regulator [Ignavibacteriota bacterium]MCB9214239.1 AraC family transcriptional regulator [Ignavibacteria bacterium]